jgi:phage terminase small subunit
MSRPRTPSAILEAKGTFDRNPARRRRDPETKGELGKAPGHLDDERAEIWDELAQNLPEGVARNADRLAFEVLVELTYKFRFQGVTGAELSNMTGLISKFGLDPASRAKVAVPVSTKEDASNPFTEFTKHE